MPSSNPLCFLRPLYDIAVWQFLQMLDARRRRDGHRVKFTYEMHRVVAYFLCKLLTARAFSHILHQMDTTEAKAATNNWSGGKPTKEIINWCQDQWRRKKNIFTKPKKSIFWTTVIHCALVY